MREDFLDLFGERRDFRIVELLVKAGANITVPNNDGETPLSFASEEEQNVILGLFFMFSRPLINSFALAWANAVDVVIACEHATEDVHKLVYYLQCHSFIWYVTQIVDASSN